ncbi:glutamine-hydrolyzing GMP synthase [Acidimicrobiaceae bacterium USS-CC1]|uniref:GMP synthase [glutamine-hydrolyzing] n=1 Tax=Acidiferrimicrobium australe TaxID=2664430 RepID=A0ABW9QY17_9ACTN|nr:glutamine-hydrolyzing GMP synthase [Acidiferrimicrobium australe]
MNAAPHGSIDTSSFDTVLVVDFGAQYAQLIARRVREAHVYSEIVPYSISPEEVAARRPAAIILSGGPKSVHQPGAPLPDPGILQLGIPVFGICYGIQVIAQQLGGVVDRSGRGEYGRTTLTLAAGSDAGPPPSVLFDHVPPSFDVWMSHFDAVVEAPDGFRVTASTPDAPVAAFEDPERRIHAVQFHPEVVHTTGGQQILKSFLYEVAGCRPTWTMTSVIDASVEAIRAQVGKERVICGLSGGVDSAVAAALVHKAIGEQLTCVFVDTGLLRAGEADQVEATFRGQFDVDLVHVKAADRFLGALDDIADPERKRKIIGETFIRVFEEAAAELGDVPFLVQGTLYPDIIESGTKDAARIKSHHNVGGLPEDMQFELVEPLRNLFKDEVRAVGEELGLPEEIVWRQPFPGPGLAVRIVGTITPERVEILRAADAIVTEEVRRAGLYRELWQSFAVLPVVRTVGVQGDERTYAHPVVIRAVTSDDAMTADWARLPYDLLERLSSRIINEVPGVNRVALDITSKPPGTIEWE